MIERFNGGSAAPHDVAIVFVHGFAGDLKLTWGNIPTISGPSRASRNGTCLDLATRAGAASTSSSCGARMRGWRRSRLSFFRRRSSTITPAWRSSRTAWVAW